MTWRAVAAPHVGHRTVLKNAYALRCVDCDMTLVIPRDLSAGTSLPPPFQPPAADAIPMPPNFRETYEQARKQRENR